MTVPPLQAQSPCNAANLAKAKEKVVARTYGQSMQDPWAWDKAMAEQGWHQPLGMDSLIDSLVLENKTHPEICETLQEEVQAWVEKSTQIHVSAPLPKQVIM